MSKKTYRLILKSTHQESEKVPDFVTGILEQSALSEEESSTLMLLLSEAVSNAIEHGNKEDPAKNVTVQVVITETQIVSTVKDEGEGFNPEQVKDPLKEENLLDTGGRGVFLLAELSDGVDYLDGGTKVRFLIKR